MPLLAYWADLYARLAEFSERLGFPQVSHSVSVNFEFTVLPPKGQGKASHTDLMILDEGIAIAKEAKYTEGKDETVANWLGDPPSRNRQLVIEGWLDLINTATGSSLTAEKVQTCGYQLIHRTASACFPDAEQRAVVYHLFDPSARRREYRARQLECLNGLMAAPNRLSFFTYETRLTKTPTYEQLEAEWRPQRRNDFSVRVRELLLARMIAAFAEPVVRKF